MTTLSSSYPLVIIGLLAFIQPSLAGSYSTDELFDLPLSELLKLEVTTATKTAESWGSSNASISVINAADITKSNARSVFELLQKIPGLSVDFDKRNVAKVNVRGIKGSPILYLLNGQPLTGVVSGAAENIAMFALPINNIKRIEIIRGPGSTLYGANALIGIVNIMTFNGQDANVSSVSAEAVLDNDNHIGGRYTINSNHQLSSTQSLNINLSFIDYDQPVSITQDIDGKAGIEEKQQQSYDVQINAKMNSIDFFSRINHYQRDDFLGITNYIDDKGQESVDSFYTNLKWQANKNKHNKTTVSVFYDYKDVDWDWNVFPASSSITAPGEVYEDWNTTGFINNILWKEEKSGIDVLNVFTGIEHHTLVMGVAAEYQRSFDIRHLSNQNPNALPQVEDVSAVYNWSIENNRSIFALYFQNTWKINTAITGNLGARYDEYSDFGSTFNPRLSLSWQANERHSLKLLYGQAFRAPDFGDLYAKNLFNSNGNPNINPETIATTEMIFNSQWNENLISTFTLFYSKLEDLVVAGTIARNEGSISSQGLETQIRYDMNHGSYISFNHTYADTQTNNNNDRSLPKNKGNIIVNHAMDDNLNIQFDQYFQEKVETNAGAFSGYSVSNINIIKRKIYNRLDVKFSIQNIFDKQYEYPSTDISKGYPADGRTFWLKANYLF